MLHLQLLLCLLVSTISQNLKIGVKIDNASCHGGLYWLDGAPTTPIQAYAVEHIVPEFLELQRWHQRLGHPSLHTLEVLFPSLVNKCKTLDLFCDTCVLAIRTSSLSVIIE